MVLQVSISYISHLQALFKPLLKNKILDQFRLKKIADDKINLIQKLKFVYGWVENIVGKGKKCWLPAFSPFSTMLSEGIYLVIVKTQDRVVKS